MRIPRSGLQCLQLEGPDQFALGGGKNCNPVCTRERFVIRPPRLLLLTARGAAIMAEFDNIQRVAPFLDRHLLLPLLEHAQAQGVRAPSLPRPATPVHAACRAS